MDSLVYDLKKENILIPGPEYNSHLIELLENGKSGIRYYDISDILWDVNLAKNGLKLSVEECFELINNQEYSAEDKSQLWRFIYLDEVSQYLHHQSWDVLDFGFNEVFNDFITDLLIEKYFLSQVYLSQIENNLREPNLSTLKNISRKLETPLPIIFFLSLNDDDISLEKSEAYKLISPSIKALLNQFFVTQ